MARRIGVKVLEYPLTYDRNDLIEVARRNCDLKQFAVNNNPPYDCILVCGNEHDANTLTTYLRGIRFVAGKRVSLSTEQINYAPVPLPLQPLVAPVHPIHPLPQNNNLPSRCGLSNGVPKKKSESLEKIRKSVRSILACNKNGSDPLRFINDYKDLCNDNFFESIKREGYRDMTDFCNDNLDTIDYEVWNNGSSVILHGVADAKSKHIYEMNKHTRNKKRPNCKPLPLRMRHFFGNFSKPLRAQVDQYNNANRPPGLADSSKRRIIAIIKEHPNGITEKDFQAEYHDKFEEPINLAELRKATGYWTLQDILGTIEDITLQPVPNAVSRWMMLRPEPSLPAEPETVTMPKDITKTEQFIKLANDISKLLKGTPEYTLQLTEIQNSHLKIDCSMYGKSTLQELVSLVPDVHIRRKNGEWIIHLGQGEQGDDLPYAVKKNIYTTLNSDGNGFLLPEFDQVYQQITGSRLNPRDYNYRSLWHLLQNNTELCMMQSIPDGLLLLAGTKPTPPPTTSRGTLFASHPPPTTQSNNPPQEPARPVIDNTRNFSTPPMFSNIEPPRIGDCEKDLGYFDFKKDGGHLLIYISVIFSPNEFYCSPFADEKRKKDYYVCQMQMKKYYSEKRALHAIGGSTLLGLNMLCVFSDENDVWHRIVVDRTTYTDVIGVRSIDTGKRYDAPVSSICHLADRFRHPCYARRCSLFGIRPFNSDRWSPETETVFGLAQTLKFYYAKLETIDNEMMEFTIIDTHGEEDRNFSEVLEAEGLAEFIQVAEQPINAPSETAEPIDADDSWLDDWIEDGEEEEELHSSVSEPQPLTAEQLQIMNTDQLKALRIQKIQRRVDLAIVLRTDVSKTHLYGVVDQDIQLIEQMIDQRNKAEPTNLWETHSVTQQAPAAFSTILNVTENRQHGQSFSDQLQEIGRSMEEMAMTSGHSAEQPQPSHSTSSQDANNFLLDLMRSRGQPAASTSLPITNTNHTDDTAQFGGRVVQGRGMGAPPPPSASFTSLGRGTIR